MYAEIFYNDGGVDTNALNPEWRETQHIYNALRIVDMPNINTVKIFTDKGKLLHTIEKRGK